MPTRVLRAAQFHEFVEQLVDWGRQGAVKLRARSAGRRPHRRRGARSPCHRLRTGPGAAIPEIAGPREESFVDLARLLVSYCGEPLQIEGVGHPDEADRALYETGALLPGENAVLAGPTFEDWLTATP